MAEKKRRFWPKFAVFYPVNNFPAIIKTRQLSFLGFWGMGHGTFYVAFNVFNKHIKLFI